MTEDHDEREEVDPREFKRPMIQIGADDEREVREAGSSTHARQDEEARAEAEEFLNPEAAKHPRQKGPSADYGDN